MTLLLVSCSNKVELAESFHTSIGVSDTDSLITSYFEYQDEAMKANLKSIYTPIFTKIKSNIALGGYEVLKYKDAKSQWDDVSKITSGIKPSKIVVVKYANDDLLYIRVSGKKFQSLLPIQKGNVITGWW